MEVTINITSAGYSKTITTKDGTVHTENWERHNHRSGFLSTHAPINLDELDMSEHLKATIEDMDTPAQDVSDELLNEIEVHTNLQ